MLYFFRSLNKQIHHIEINFEWFVPQFGTIEKKDANHRHLVKDASSHEGTKNNLVILFSNIQSTELPWKKTMPDLAHEGTKKSGDFLFLKNLLTTSLMNLSVGSVARENDGRCSTALPPMMALSPGVGATHTTPHGGGQLLPMSLEPQMEGSKQLP